MPRTAHGEVRIRHVSQIGDLAVDFGRRGDEFIAQPKIEGEMRLPPVIVLQKERQQRFSVTAVRINPPGHGKSDRVRLSLQEGLKAREGFNPSELTRGVLIELHALAFASKTQAVAPVG